MIEKIFTIQIFSICLLVFIPSLFVAVVTQNLLIRRLRTKNISLYNKVIGKFDDSYLKRGQSILFFHGLRLDALVFGGKYIKEIGVWTTIIYVVSAIGFYPTLFYMIIYIFLAVASVIEP